MGNEKIPWFGYFVGWRFFKMEEIANLKGGRSC
jgi:hypothetical protein